jgi:uncharacterized protein (PEP-CTERM system associated)
MAKRQHGAAQRRVALPLAAPVAALALALAPAARAEIKFTPSVALSETWTDNVNLAPPDTAQRQFITDLAPTLALVSNTRSLQLSAAYTFHQYAYAHRDVPNVFHSNRQLQAAARARLVPELLYVDAGANRGQQSVSAFGPLINDNPWSAVNRTEVSTWHISPYLVHRFGSDANMMLRYSRDAVDTGTQAFGNTRGDSVVFDLSSARERRLGWDLHYQRQRLEDRVAGPSESQSAQAQLNYRLTPGLALTAGGGYDDYDYKTLGGRTRGNSWSTGFAWNPSPRTSLQASIGHRYFGKTAALAATHRSRHTVWNINYNEAVTTSRQQYLLPSTIDTVAMLDRLFAPTISDPEARRAAVDAYLRATGLPPSLANNVNYLSNRYMLQKQFQASAAFSGSRSVLLVSANDMRRNALSLQQFDSDMIGNTLASLNENVRLQMVNAVLTYRLSPRSQLIASASAGRDRSLSTGIKSNNGALRLGVSRQFGRKLQGTLEARKVRGNLGATSGVAGRDYREKAISATLSLKF